MPRENRHNAAAGRAFQEEAADVLGRHFGVTFELEVPLPIGTPSKPHKFDLVSACGRFVGECKKYSWPASTTTGSAKMAPVNEAVLYLQHVSPQCVRFIVLEHAAHPRTGETLAESYWRTNRHLLCGILLFELNPFSDELRELTGSPDAEGAVDIRLGCDDEPEITLG
jgi:hypothetical protein